MTTPLSTVTRTLVCLGTLLAAHLASAFYDPSLQRWITRDPIGEPGFRKAAGRVSGAGDKAQLYAPLHNNPIQKLDPYGLAVWLCTVPTRDFPFYGRGRHAYFWDDRSPVASHSCSMQGSSGSKNTSDPEDIGPIGTGEIWTGAILEDGYWAYGDTECRMVQGSEGNESTIMDYCRKCANPLIGPIPGITDCHNRCEKTLKATGFPVPPHRYFNPDDFPPLQGPIYVTIPTGR